jgi:3-mercaptopyruvate sulfurtransferase SseA
VTYRRLLLTLALVDGHENVRVLQGGFAQWKAKGGFDAKSKAAAAAEH